MRKLNVGDFRAATSFAARHKDKIFELIGAADIESIDKQQFGADILSLLICDDAVDVLFARFADITGRTVEEFEDMDLDDLPDILAQIVRDNDVRSFFTRLSRAVIRGESPTSAAADTAGR